MKEKDFAIRTASAEELLLKDLPHGVTLLPHDFEGETTRVMFEFAVSKQTVNNPKFDTDGFIKAKFDNALTAFRHRQNIKELHLSRRFHVVIDPENERDKTQIYIHIEYAKI